MTQAAKNTLVKFKSDVKWTTSRDLPGMPGMAIGTLLKTYKIPAIKWGYKGTLIGIETKKQFMFWRDKGGELEFKGLLDK